MLRVDSVAFGLFFLFKCFIINFMNICLKNKRECNFYGKLKDFFLIKQCSWILLCVNDLLRLLRHWRRYLKNLFYGHILFNTNHPVFRFVWIHVTRSLNMSQHVINMSETCHTSEYMLPPTPEFWFYGLNCYIWHLHGSLLWMLKILEISIKDYKYLKN